MPRSTLDQDLANSAQQFPGEHPSFSQEQPFVGREDDIIKLSQLLTQHPQERSVMIMVEGEAGVGKTAFIQQLILDCGDEFSFRLYGKFHNVPSKVPYLALKQCVQCWLDQLLALDDEAYEKLRVKLREAVHPHERVLTSVFEELEIFYGKKSIPDENNSTDPQKERLRFSYYFHKFFKAIYESGFRTVLFLDDLQWADLATLHLLYDLLNLYEVPGLVIISALRPHAEGPIPTQLQKLEALSLVSSFPLKPLAQNNLSRLIPADWKLSEEEQKAFLEYLLLESGGKPFDALQILSLVVQEKLVEKVSGDKNQIRWSQLPHFKQNRNAIALVRRELEDLRKESIELLKIASCVGFYISCQRLRNICLLPPDSVTKGLEELAQRKIIIIQQEVCYFVHDHFFSAAQSLLLPGEKKGIHRTIARYLMSVGALDPQSPDFFECVNHLNIAGVGDALLFEDELALVNMAAAKLAQKKSAFDKSLDYFKIAEQLLSSVQTKNQIIQAREFIPIYPNLPNPLYYEKAYHHCMLGIAEGEFLVQNFVFADQASNYILDHEEDRILRLEAYTIKLKICVACLSIGEAPVNLKDGMGITEALLKDYGIRFPQSEAEYEKEVIASFHELKSLINQHDNTWLETREISEDKEFKELIYFIVLALPIIFFVNVNKSKYLAIRSTLMCVQKGFTPNTPALFASSIWTIASLGQDLALAYQLGLLGLKLVERPSFQTSRQAVYHLATLNFYNWKHHYREASAKLDEVTEYSLGLGDHHYAVMCNTNARVLDVFRGVPLSKHPFSSDSSKAEIFKDNFFTHCHSFFVNYMNGQLKGLVEGSFMFERKLKLEAEKNLNYLFHLSFIEEQLYFHVGKYEEALKAGDICEKYRFLYEAFPIGNEHDFFYCLILCQLAQEKGYLSDSSRAIIEGRLGEIKKLAAMGSGNYLHKQKILEAELERLAMHTLVAISLYDEAIEVASKNDFVNYAALAAERAGTCLLKIGKKRLSEVYFNDAYRFYQQWGAFAKIVWLKKEYKEVSFLNMSSPVFNNGIVLDQSGTLNWSLIDSAIGLSNELYLNDLISKTLKISSGHSQAQMAFFVLKSQYSWQVVARLNKDGVRLLHHNLDTVTNEVPKKMLHECLQQKKIIFIPSTHGRSDLSDKMFFQSRGVQACMLIPLEKHHEISALIYLENVRPEVIEKENLLPWFELLRVQAGIALFNAQLYENQVKLNHEIRKQEQKRIDAIVETQEKERRRVAAELHDHLGQMLSLSKINLSRLEDSLEGQYALYEETSRLLDESCSELRRIAHDMMPPDVNDQLLPVILEKLFRTYLLAAGVKYHFYHQDLPEQIPVGIKFNLYRIAQEIIHNIIKHAAASKVMIELSMENERLHMMIEDDGKGFDTRGRMEGLGLKSLYTRVNLLNGRLEIDSIVGRGSVFQVYVPLL